MAGMIPRNFIDDLLNRVDIVEVIDSRVPLKKKGREYWACCPFHGEKSPSFSVSSGKQFYHCFGCQKSGNAVGFLMDYDHMEFVEAIESLAQSLGLDVPYE
jgi:DNA primase